MSLTPKIDEVRKVMQETNPDLVCITETGLHSQTCDDVVNICGYNLVRRYRLIGQHGAVCICTYETQLNSNN